MSPWKALRPVVSLSFSLLKSPERIICSRAVAKAEASIEPKSVKSVADKEDKDPIMLTR